MKDVLEWNNGFIDCLSIKHGMKEKKKKKVNFEILFFFFAANQFLNSLVVVVVCGTIKHVDGVCVTKRLNSREESLKVFRKKKKFQSSKKKTISRRNRLRNFFFDFLSRLATSMRGMYQ